MKNLCEQAPLYFYGELDPAQTAQFKAHLPSCPACQKEFAFLAQTQAALVPPSAPQAVVDSVLQTGKQSFWKRIFKPGLVAATIVLLLAVYMGPKLVWHTAQLETGDWVAYVSEEADVEYQNFLKDFEAFEAEF